MTNNSTLSVGVSATLSIPMDREHKIFVKEAATTHNEYRAQLLANKRLDFEMGLKNCGELFKTGHLFSSQITILCCMC